MAAGPTRLLPSRNGDSAHLRLSAKLVGLGFRKLTGNHHRGYLRPDPSTAGLKPIDILRQRALVEGWRTDRSSARHPFVNASRGRRVLPWASLTKIRAVVCLAITLDPVIALLAISHIARALERTATETTLLDITHIGAVEAITIAFDIARNGEWPNKT
jgi:hypothetical protein